MHILLRCHFASTSGYGRDGIGIAQALMRMGHTVDVYPELVGPPLPKDVAELFTYPIKPDGYDIELHHVPPTSAFAGKYNKTRAKKVVLWTMWEWDTFPEQVEGYDKAEEYIKKYDHVVGYTPQTLLALDKFLGEGQQTSVVQGGFDPDPWVPAADTPYADQYPRRIPADAPFIFSMVGHLAIRKNPYVALIAFNNLKKKMGDDFNAEFWFKTGYPLMPPDYDAPGVKFIQEIGWSNEDLRKFYWKTNCLVNCAWGEGKDLPPMEATMCGTPVLINDTDGHRGWVHPSIQPLVPATTKDAGNGYIGRYTDVDDLAEAMLHCYNNRYEALNRADQLASFISKTATWDRKLKKLGEEIGVPL